VHTTRQTRSSNSISTTAVNETNAGVGADARRTQETKEDEVRPGTPFGESPSLVAGAVKPVASRLLSCGVHERKGFSTSSRAPLRLTSLRLVIKNVLLRVKHRVLLRMS
jgi:hypothetical protein